MSSATLFALLSDPTKPTPFFIDGWAPSEFAGMIMTGPTASGLPNDNMSIPILEYTVSGTAGDASLSISAGDQSKGTGNWAAALIHDDGTYGFYTVTALASNTCTIWPKLRSTTTNKTLRNVGSPGGQHYSSPAYQALGRFIYSVTRSKAYRNRWIAQWRSSDPKALPTDWTRVGGLGSGQVGISAANNFITGASSKTLKSFTARGANRLTGIPVSPFTGKGFTKNFALAGNSGYVELHCNAALGATTFYPVTVSLKVDGVEFYNHTFTENDGLVHVWQAFPAGATGTCTVTFADETPAAFTSLQIDQITWWVYDRTPSFSWSDPVIKKNGKVVVLGDSWSVFYPTVGGGQDGILGRELQQAMADDGGSGTVTGVGMGGQTAEWGLSVFDSVVAPLNPDQVLIEFFVNDRNTYGDTGYDRWLRALWQIGLKCQAIGAEPVFLGPLPVSVDSQARGHGIYSDQMLKGLSL